MFLLKSVLPQGQFSQNLASVEMEPVSRVPSNMNTRSPRCLNGRRSVSGLYLYIYIYIYIYNIYIFIYAPPVVDVDHLPHLLPHHLHLLLGPHRPGGPWQHLNGQGFQLNQSSLDKIQTSCHGVNHTFNCLSTRWNDDQWWHRNRNIQRKRTTTHLFTYQSLYRTRDIFSVSRRSEGEESCETSSRLAILDTSQPAADSGAAGGRRGYMQHSQEFALQSQFSQTSVTLQCTNLSQWN